MYLTNAWYVGAWADEISRTLFSRTICEQSILMYRREDGVPVALGNRCPHRFAPLTMGRLRGDEVQCGYHGMVFGDSGKCVRNPHRGGHIPEAMRVRKYPILERHGLLWLWMGDPEAANSDLIPDFSCLVDPRFKTLKGVIEIEANYELITDNLLDLTHVELVHEGLLSSPAVFASELQTVQAKDSIWSNRWVPNGQPPPVWAKLFSQCKGASPHANVDHWLYMRWDAPAHLLLDVGVTHVGGTREDGVWVYGTDILTPSSNTHSLYFWAVSRDHDLDDADVDAFWMASIDGAFVGQDKPMIEAQQRMLGERTLDEMRPVLIPADKAAGKAHRHLQKLIGALTPPMPGGVSLSALQREAKGSASPVNPVV